MLKVKEIKCDFIISEVPDHPKHKSMLLDLIDKIPNNPYLMEGEEVSKTDWNLPLAFERKYLEYFYSRVAKNIMDQQQKYFKAKKWEIRNGWFQQYQEGSSHVYHSHPNVNFTNVYFLELPDKQFKTSLKIKEKEYDYEVKEGQLITFPAHILHTSKKNSTFRKTIISFNTNFIF